MDFRMGHKLEKSNKDLQKYQVGEYLKIKKKKKIVEGLPMDYRRVLAAGTLLWVTWPLV